MQTPFRPFSPNGSAPAVATVPAASLLSPSLHAQQLAACQDFRQALVDFGRVAAIALAPLSQEFERTLRDWYQFLQDAYERAGRPCGDTPDGFKQWCEEQAQAERRAQVWEWKPLPTSF